MGLPEWAAERTGGFRSQKDAGRLPPKWWASWAVSDKFCDVEKFFEFVRKRSLAYLNMVIERRYFIAGSAALALPGMLRAEEEMMFGLIGKMIAKPGQRDALITLVLEGADSMPGCTSYIVAKDAGDENGIWITEVWDSEASHSASLKLPSVAASISKAIPLIEMEAKGIQQKTVPVGGTGIR